MCSGRKKTLEAKFRDAAEEGDVAACKRFIRQREVPLDLNSTNEDGWAALHLATNEGQFAVVTLLLELGANVSARTKQMKTPLHIACCRGDLRTVKLLVQNKADLAAQDIEGNTCLHTVSTYGMNKIMEWFAGNAAEVGLRKHADIRNFAGKTAADLAANPDLLALLGTKRAAEPQKAQTKQIHVYHTDQLCVNKYMGNMMSKPSGDADEEGMDSLTSSYAEASEKPKVNVVRGPMKEPQQKTPSELEGTFHG